MDLNKQAFSDYFKSLQVVHFGLLAGQIFFGLVILFQVRSKNLIFEGKDLENVLSIVLGIGVLAGIFGSRMFFENRLKIAQSKSDLNEKLNDYKAALIFRYALLEGPSIFAIVVALITGNLLFLGLSLLIALYFFTLRPVKENVIRDLMLNNK